MGTQIAALFMAMLGRHKPGNVVLKMKSYTKFSLTFMCMYQSQ